jgi:hypothetical protein
MNSRWNCHFVLYADATNTSFHTLIDFMNAHLKYKQNSSLAWTRIDMLLVVYNLTVAALDEGARLIEQNRTAELAPVRLRAMRRLIAIADGLDLNQEGLPIQILRLVEV